MEKLNVAEIKSINSKYKDICGREPFYFRHGKWRPVPCTYREFECDCVFTRWTQWECPDYKAEDASEAILWIL